MSDTIELTRKEFQNAIIAQDDDCDYSESGYVAILHEGTAAIGKYGHCSCYDTFESLGGSGYYDDSKGTLNFIWTGSIEALIEMAQRNADPHMPERTADETDCDYDHLQNVYQGILKRFKNV